MNFNLKLKMKKSRPYTYSSYFLYLLEYRSSLSHLQKFVLLSLSQINIYFVFFGEHFSIYFSVVSNLYFSDLNLRCFLVFFDVIFIFS